MTSALPINVQDLLLASGVESARVEFKAGWDETPNGTAAQVLRTICAFANDIYNLNGGYIVLGVAASDGRPILPPRGLDPADIERVQRWIRGKCKERIDPEYQPRMSPEVVEGHHLLVLWCPGSDNRPHRATESLEKGAARHHYVRLGAETVVAQGSVYRELLDLTARVPFDDRRASGASVEDLQSSLVREYLHDVRSGLTEEADTGLVYRRLQIVKPANGHEIPVNVGLLFFTDDPERWFRGARIEVAHFADDTGGDLIEERVFRGPLHHQIRYCVSYLRNLSTSLVEKQPDRPETTGWVSYPLPALEESVANAVYHRGYEGPPEPTKVHLFADRIEVISYPGPATSLRREHLLPGGRVPPLPARNRRIGEFLKSLHLAEARGTGVPKIFRAMERNGSPVPAFDFDDARTYFRVTLPAHPEWVAVSALRDAAQLRAVGKTREALSRLGVAFESSPHLGSLATELIRMHAASDDAAAALVVFERFMSLPQRRGEGAVVLAMANVLADKGDSQAAQRVMERMPERMTTREAIEAAIQEKRLDRLDRAHDLFERAGPAVFDDVHALHEFAQIKSRLAQGSSGSQLGDQARQRLLRDAEEMLQRVTQLPAPELRHAWAWLDLAYVLRRIGAPHSEVRQALVTACQLAPNDGKFVVELQKFDRES
jgi:ATP-dependent DNA helicase RecG